MVMKKVGKKQHKCPYISPVVECLSTGTGRAVCFDRKFHEQCDHRKFADERMGKTIDKNTVIDVNLIVENNNDARDDARRGGSNRKKPI